MSNSSAIVRASMPLEGIEVDFGRVGLTSVQHRFVLVYAITLGLATLTIIFRLYTRIQVVKNVGIDDFAATLALFLSAAFFGCAVYNFEYGLGRHLRDISANSLVKYTKILVPTVAVYLWAPSFTKFSILLLYHKVNPSKPFRWSLYGVGFVTFTNAIITTVITAAGCAVNATTNAICINRLALGNAVINIGSEFAIMLIPLPFVYNLHLPIRQRIAVGIIFSAASFVLVVSIIRVTYVAALLHQTDSTWVQGKVCVWSAFEINVGIICNCAIALKPFFRHYLPRFLSSSSQDEGSRGISGSRTAFTILNKRDDRNSKPDAYELSNVKTRASARGPSSPPEDRIEPLNTLDFDIESAQKSQIVVTSSYSVAGSSKDDCETGSTEDILPREGQQRKVRKIGRDSKIVFL